MKEGDPLKRINYLEDLKNHKYFRHTFPILENHPFAKGLIACHSAVLVKGNNIISVGFNKPKHHALVRLHAPHDNMTIHAEVDCIIKARKKHDLTGCSLYVARAQKTDNCLSMSKPCPTCHAILQKYGIRHVYYTTYMNGIRYLDLKQEYCKVENWKTHYMIAA